MKLPSCVNVDLRFDNSQSDENELEMKESKPMTDFLRFSRQPHALTFTWHASRKRKLKHEKLS